MVEASAYAAGAFFFFKPNAFVFGGKLRFFNLFSFCLMPARTPQNPDAPTMQALPICLPGGYSMASTAAGRFVVMTFSIWRTAWTSSERPRDYQKEKGTQHSDLLDGPETRNGA